MPGTARMPGTKSSRKKKRSKSLQRAKENTDPQILEPLNRLTKRWSRDILIPLITKEDLIVEEEELSSPASVPEEVDFRNSVGYLATVLKYCVRYLLLNWAAAHQERLFPALLLGAPIFALVHLAWALVLYF